MVNFRDKVKSLKCVCGKQRSQFMSRRVYIFFFFQTHASIFLGHKPQEELSSIFCFSHLTTTRFEEEL